MKKNNVRIPASPLGPIRVSASATGVTALAFEGFNGRPDPSVTSAAPSTPEAAGAITAPPAPEPSNPTPAPDASQAIATDAAAQVAAYLAGERRSIDVPIDWSVLEPFQAEVLHLVAAIPPGETRTYGQLATALDRPGGARAVGRANAANPMPLVLPCHRVVAADGGMGGYSGPGGVETKAWLLQREGAALL